jgi:hypothetical protein
MQNIKFNAYVDSELLKNPGIGRYTLEEEVMLRTARAPAFSMGHRTKPADLRRSIESQNKNPSPAHYENNPEMSKTLFGSSFKKTSFSISSSKRFQDDSKDYHYPDNNVPGPAAYTNPTNLLNIGKYLVSSQKGGTNAKFDKSARVTHFDKAIQNARNRPGPGAYKACS